MAPPVTDLRLRSRNAGAPIDAIPAVFEALSGQISGLRSQIRTVILGQRIQLGLLLLMAAAVLAPYVAAWSDVAG